MPMTIDHHSRSDQPPDPPESPSPDRLSAVIDAVYEHWILQRNLDLAVATEMRDELADHLATAAADGKPVDVITGPDLRAFADEWADAHQQRPGWADRLSLLAVGALAFVAATVTMAALDARSLTVEIDPIRLLVAALLGGAAASLFLSPLGSRLGHGTRVRRPVVAAFGFALGWVAVMVAAIATVDRLAPTAVWTVPAWLVVPLALATVVVLGAPLIGRLGRAQNVGWVRRLLDIISAGLP